VLVLQRGQNFPGAVARTIVNADQFQFLRNGQNAFYHRAQGIALVVDGHDYRNSHGRSKFSGSLKSAHVVEH
jgi:hypothetical protein